MNSDYSRHMILKIRLYTFCPFLSHLKSNLLDGEFIIWTYNLAPGEAVLAWGPPAKPADACYQAAGWVVAQFADGNAKWGWRNQPAGISFTGQPADAGFNKGSQMGAAIELACSLPTVAGVCALPGNPIEASTFGSLDRIRYQIALDPVDLVPSLYRSATGGFNPATAGFLPPPNPLAWQLVARGIEDLQVRYRTFGGWQGSAPMINPAAAVGVRFDNIVREVEVTLWARTVGEGKLVGETTAANGAVAVRGSAVTSMAPRAAQIALMNETVLAKRWQ